MHARLSYVIKFVADMSNAVRYHRDRLGIPLKFETPEWSEFATGDVTLALHAASDQNPAGTVQLGYAVDDLSGLYAGRAAAGIDFTDEPQPLHGALLARFRDCEGAECSISGRR